jgi:hypothetical protein
MLPTPCVMNMQIRRLLFLTALIAMICGHSSAVAQDKNWLEIKEKPLVKFDWNCSAPSIYPKAKLSRLVEVAQKKVAAVGTAYDRAFAFDLNNDGRPEYFVPLVCGATGNCDWGVFALRPARFLGAVNGQYIYIHKRAGRWPGVITYGHLSAAEGSLYTYLFRKGRYSLLGKGYPIGPVNRTLEIQGVTGRPMPRFLEKARPACKDIGG